MSLSGMKLDASGSAIAKLQQRIAMDHRFMIDEDFTRQIWMEVEDLLTVYDGSLSEIFIIELPIERLHDAIHLAAESLDRPQLRNVEVATGEWRDVRYDDDLLDELQHPSRISMVGEFGPEECLQIYFELYEADQVFIIEIVFTNWTSFGPERQDEWMETLAAYLMLVEKLRMGYAESRVVFAPEFNGNPRASVNEEYATVVDI